MGFSFINKTKGDAGKLDPELFLASPLAGDPPDVVQSQVLSITYPEVPEIPDDPDDPEEPLEPDDPEDPDVPASPITLSPTQ